MSYATASPLTPVPIARTAIDLTLGLQGVDAVNGNRFMVTPVTLLRVVNAAETGSVRCTLWVPPSTDGLAVANKTFDTAEGSSKLFPIGLYAKQLRAFTGTQEAFITFDFATDVTAAPYQPLP